MSARLTILGSGSGGNCAYLETAETRLLIDAGLTARQIRQRLAALGRAPENLTAILLTHEHNDHIQGLAPLAGKLGVPVYCNRATQDTLVWQLETKLDYRIFATGARISVGDVEVESFSVPHDAADPVGFLVRTTAGTIGFATDLGHVTKLVIERARQANVLVLETNHDVKMLQECMSRPWSLKQRILGRHGHLSNDAAAQALEDIVSAELRQLYLAHLSRDCNRPELARRVVGERLEQLGAHHVAVQLTWQTEPCPVLDLGAFPTLSGAGGSGSCLPASGTG